MAGIKIHFAQEFNFNIIFQFKSIFRFFENGINVRTDLGKNHEPDAGGDIAGVRVFFTQFKKYMLFIFAAVISLYFSANPQGLRESRCLKHRG